jgi:hypothetical protein
MDKDMDLDMDMDVDMNIGVDMDVGVDTDSGMIFCFDSNRNIPKLDLFRFCFGLFSETLM